MRVVPVPSTALIGLENILKAFALGADSVLVIEGEHDIDEKFTRERMDDFKDELDDLGIDSMRLYYNLVQLPAYKNIARIFELYTTTIDDLGPVEPEIIEELREKLAL
jgi:coenzyme F420-reducing hydrogenase delta subunit